ncbi:MAG: hypothetical protein QM652_12625 [Legionella sp.]|uniref:hypothetical protein n=1 Tax=Legionella sp. TaxID=459 RepID=UPI0039E5618E
MQCAYILLYPPGNVDFLTKAYNYYDEIKRLTPCLIEQEQKKMVDVLTDVLLFFIDIHKENTRDVRKTKLNSKLRALRSVITQPLINKDCGDRMEMIKNYLMLIFHSWSKHKNIKIKNIIKNSFFKTEYPILSHFYIECFDMIIDIYDVCKQSNPTDYFIAMLKELSISEYNDIKSFIEFCKEMVEINQIISENFDNHSKKSLVMCFCSQLEKSLEESNNQAQIAQIQAQEFIKELEQQYSIKNKIFKKSPLNKTQSPKKATHSTGQYSKKEHSDTTPKITPEDAAYKFFEKNSLMKQFVLMKR